MKIRAKANGNIVDVSDGEAEALLASGIYEPVDEPWPFPADKLGKTTVAPLTAADLNPRAGKPSTATPKKQGGKR